MRTRDTAAPRGGRGAGNMPALASSLRAPARARSALGERQLALINRIARIATEDLDLVPMLKRVVEAMREGFGWEFVAFLSLDLRARVVVCEAVATVLDTELDVGRTVPIGEGVCGHVALSGNAVLVRDVREFPNYVPAVPGVRSELCVPVRHRGELLGVIDVESVEVDAFADQQELLATVADQLAGAVAAARLHQELARRAALLALMSEVSHTALQSDQLPDVLARIGRFVQHRFAIDACTIRLGGRGDEDAIATRALRLAQPLWIPDAAADPGQAPGTPGVARFVVPIRYHERLLGVLDAAGTREALSVDVRNVLRAVADQIAGAIHLVLVNQRLLDTIQLFEDKSEQLESANDQLRVANGKLERLSSLDGLTGIANRRQFDQTLRSEWRRARRRGHVVSLLLVDIDRFKAYNDGYGHLQGDECLKQVARVLATTVRRAEDLVARFGGEEFAVLLPETEPKDALKVAEALRAGVLALAAPHRYSELGQVSISVGVGYAIPHGSLLPSQLIGMADKALYAAKSDGRNLVRPYRESMSASGGARVPGGSATEHHAATEGNPVAPER